MKDVLVKPINQELFFLKIKQYIENHSKDQDLISVDSLMENLNFNYGLLNKLLNVFIDSYPQKKKDLLEKFNDQDTGSLHDIIHKLKSELSNFKAEKAINSIRDCSKLLLNDIMIEEKSFNDLFSELEQVVDAMKELKNKINEAEK